MATLPTFDVDLYSDAVLDDPYDLYRELRNAGPVVHLSRYGFYALPRYDDVRAALGDWQRFSSAKGVAMNDQMNDILAGTVIATDPPEHMRLRKILERPIAPKEVAALRGRIVELAEALAARLSEMDAFDAASDLAHYLPLTVVSELIGLPEEGRQRILAWAAASFDIMAAAGAPRMEEAGHIMGEMMEYVMDPSLPERLRPDGWAARLFNAVETGEIAPGQPEVMIQGYLNPSLDTTIFATTNLIWLFARYPDQWQELRENPALVPRAINEAIRLESPIQHFSRVTTEDVQIDGSLIPAHSRILVMYGSANRDERHYQMAEKFDVRRENSDHLGFGYANHMCVGMNLAKLEITALVQALLPRISRFELVDAKRARNNLLRGFESLKVRVHR